jgi:peptide/nickel transport system substrate-binding protein
VALIWFARHASGGVSNESRLENRMLAAKARITTASKARQTIYRQIQRRLNSVGPFFPLLQPTQVFVSTKDLKNAVFNAVYQVDVTQVAPK